MEFVKFTRRISKGKCFTKDYDFEGHMELVPMQPGDGCYIR